MSAADSLFELGSGTKDLAIGLVILVGVGALVYWIAKRGVGGVTSDLTSSAVQAAGGIGTGAVKGIAAVAGIPDTNQDECSKALAEGRMWDASFACPASRFIAGVFGAGSGSTPPLTQGQAATNDPSQYATGM